MLINADAFNGTANTSFTSVSYIVYTEYTYTTNSAIDGKFFWKNGYDQISFQYDKYQHIFKTTPNGTDITSFLILSNNYYSEIGEWNNNKNYKLRFISNKKKESPTDRNLVTINIKSDIPLDSYKGSLSYSSSDTVCYIRLNDENNKQILSKDITSNIYEWNPMHIAGNQYSGTKNNTYWWN